MGGNRTGKSFCICYEGACHLTGIYPKWWDGFEFTRPIVAWAAGEDVKAVRESLQPTLMGPAEARGTGLIPAANILRAPSRSGVPDALDFVEIKHRTGGMSRLLFKAYEQGRESFQASAVDLALLDEEPPLPIYTEMLTRTLSTVPGQPNGLVLCAFTPLKGISATVLQFLPGGAYPATEELRKMAWGW
ncbi:MAG TPA: terminase family protein [Candidatus Dormibacteraeota bacterium]|nr:terminase family protein [Candidatus Dormibacteraeota bacterium]